jgi:hypothetical protein
MPASCEVREKKIMRKFYPFINYDQYFFDLLLIYILELYVYLEFLKSETTTSTKLGVVLDGGATDSWAKKAINGSRSDASSLLDACNSSRLLATGLIEPGLDTALPVLTEMLIGQLIVVFQNHCSTVWLDFASK